MQEGKGTFRTAVLCLIALVVAIWRTVGFGPASLAAITGGFILMCTLTVIYAVVGHRKEPEKSDEIIRTLVTDMRTWGGWEDGVPEEFESDYYTAKNYLAARGYLGGKGE